MSYFKSCLANGNGSIRVVLAFSAVVFFYGDIVPTMALGG